MLGFIVAGLKLVGKIIVKAVKAAVIGTVVGCVSNNWKDLKNTTDGIIDGAVDEIDKKKEELKERVRKEGKNYKLSWKEKIILLALLIKWLTAGIYGIILGAMTCAAVIIDGIFGFISKIIFKSTKEEEILCSE